VYEHPPGGVYLDFFLLRGSVCSQISEGSGDRRTGAADSIAKRAGLQTGDQIVDVHGNRIRTWEDLEVALGTAPRDALNIEVLRGKPGGAAAF